MSATYTVTVFPGVGGRPPTLHLAKHEDLSLERLNQITAADEGGPPRVFEQLVLGNGLVLYCFRDTNEADPPSCRVFGPALRGAIDIRGPAIFAATLAKTKEQAFLTVAMHMELLRVEAPPEPAAAPYIFPVWPTIQ